VASNRKKEDAAVHKEKNKTGGRRGGREERGVEKGLRRSSKRVSQGGKIARPPPQPKPIKKGKGGGLFHRRNRTSGRGSRIHRPAPAGLKPAPKKGEDSPPGGVESERTERQLKQKIRLRLRGTVFLSEKKRYNIFWGSVIITDAG